MASFEDFVGKKEKPKLTNADGSFSCQHCEEVVTSALFDEIAGTITWVCDNGHESQVSI